MPPTLLSVNIGQLAALSPTQSKRTGIHKHPVGGAVLCDAAGLVGDRIGNRTHHGGPDQAVYLYSAADYAWWSSVLGRPCPPGLFGENLTIDAWWEAPRVGDRVTFGDVTFELTAPRIPCATLAGRLGDPTFVKTFADARRCGAYARVITGGALEAGAVGAVVRGDAAWPTIDTLFDAWFRAPRDRTPGDRAALLAFTRAPIAARARDTFLRWATEGLA